jgi:hypothetical protein
MGNAPKAILLSFALVNVPSLIYNIAVGPSLIWGDSYAPLVLGILFQLMCNVFLFMASFTDPGVIPTVETKATAPESTIDNRYRNIKHK